MLNKKYAEIKTTFPPSFLPAKLAYLKNIYNVYLNFHDSNILQFYIKTSFYIELA